MALRKEFLLANGTPAVFEMPDMLALISGNVDIPNSALADVLDLALGGSFAADADEQLAGNKRYVRAVYELAALCLVTPKVYIPRGKKVRPLREGEIGTQDLAWAEVVTLYNWFRYGVPASLPAAAPLQPGVGDATAPAGDDLPHDAE